MFFIVNSNDKGMTSEISPSKDLIYLKARNNHRVHVSVLRSNLYVLVFLLKERHWNFKKKKLSLQIGCAAYLQVWLIPGLLW